MATHPTAERRALGQELKRYRIAQGLTQQAVAEVAGVKIPQISRVENGNGNLDAHQLKRVLELLRVPEEVATDLKKRAASARRKQHRRGSLAERDRLLPESYRWRAGIEVDAVSIMSYDTGIIPGLLQSPQYMITLMSYTDGFLWEPSETEIQARIAYRQQRQQTILQSSPPKRLHFTFTADALDVDDDDIPVMREQLQHLIWVHEHYPNVTIQIDQSNKLKNPIAGGGVTILDFGDAAPRVALAHVAYGPSTIFDKDQDSLRLLHSIIRVQQLALDPTTSINLIKKRLRELA